MNEEVLVLEPLHSTTKCKDIYDALMKVINGIDNINSLSATVTNQCAALK